MTRAPRQRAPAKGRAGLLLRAPSQRSAIDSFIVMDVMRRAARAEASGRSIIHMEVGQPATPAPKAAREAVARALGHDTLGYTLALGTGELRARIARHYGDTYDVDLDPARVVVTAGSSGAFVLAFLALFDTGARVALPVPGYPCYRHILKALGCVPEPLMTGPETRWMPTVAAIEAVHRERPLDGLILASPANPTGTMIEPGRLAEIADFCSNAGIWLISDEIYHGLGYDLRAVTALAASRDTVVVNSFSKYFSMTGWRVGWMVVPEALVRSVEKLAQNLFISPAAPSQMAALGAFDASLELKANAAVYAANRRLLLEQLPTCGFRDFAPADGAFYLYADISHLAADSAELSARLLAEAGVSVTPGLDFDAERGHRYLRFSYAGATADMAEAVHRLEAWHAAQANGSAKSERRLRGRRQQGR